MSALSCVLVDVPKFSPQPLTSPAIPPQQSAATRRWTHLSFSQGVGEANLLRLRDTDREHRVKVCVLAPQTSVHRIGCGSAAHYLST
jgi:hypothetical protein